MRGKNILVIALTAVLFLSAVFLGIASVYRITAVQVLPITYSKEAEEEVEDLQQRLMKAYDKQSFFSVDSKAAEKIMEEFPYLRMTSFVKSEPNRIIVEIVEDEEVYAIPVDNNGELYYTLGKDGIILGIRSSYVNRLDGGESLLIKGFNGLSGKKGEMITGDSCLPSFFDFCQKVSEKLSGIRRNVVLIEVLHPTSSQKEVIVRLTMTEGVKIYVGNISQLTHEKAEAVIDCYLSLNDQERTTGRIATSDHQGQLVVGYAKNDEFGL